MNIRQGQTTSAADRALIIAQIKAKTGEGMPLRQACAEVGIAHCNYYRWNHEAAPIQTPKAKTKRGRKAKFELGEADARRLRFWRLVKGTIPLALDAFIAEALSGDEEPYFAALRSCIETPHDTGHRASPELAKALADHWKAATNARKVVTWPLSVQRACRVTAAEEAAFCGRKAAEAERGKERRSGLIRTEDGLVIPWYAGAIWESDDMSVNDPFRFHDSATGSELLGRQILATIDAYSLNWLGQSHIGRERDSYRAEDIASHFRELVELHGLPLIWRIEKGRWDNDFIWGCKIGVNEAGEDIRWGGLDAIIHIRDKHTSDGKANVEGSFDLLQALLDHGGNGQTLSIGRERGEFEYATKTLTRAHRGQESALAKFWTIEQSADAVARTMAVFNQRPKKRQAFGNETRVPAELWAEHVKRPCPSDHLWRFHAVKTKATVRKGIIEVRAPHYPLSFRFRVHGGSRTPNVHCDNGHEVLIAFTPSAPEEGCHVFNADRSARNREGWKFGERLGIAEHMPDALQEDLYAASYSPGQKRATAQVRKETRLLLADTPFAGRRVSHAQDGFGSRLTQATRAAAGVPPEEPAAAPAATARSQPLEAAPRQPRSTGLEAPRLSLATGPRHETPAVDLDEAEEAAALAAI
ncbi:MAG TPA: hypothetical protein VGE39_00750 [Prosthecobacter sp.]